MITGNVGDSLLCDPGRLGLSTLRCHSMKDDDTERRRHGLMAGVLCASLMHTVSARARRVRNASKAPSLLYFACQTATRARNTEVYLVNVHVQASRASSSLIIHVCPCV